ncbi:unnamed protein product [Lactuca virosa]|uniref:Protein AAR2 homolog n=1 Tax=Lactuca virosa TaxID=75947 RepID=A0AAU9ML48_9ASTR|nr:unnamed protein product [Lactuca virosa]
MYADTTLELVKKGASLLFLDVPQHTLLGIDTQMFSVGPNFKGIKMIPPGPHFIYYSSSNRGGSEFSPMIGFFIDLNPSQVIVRKWDQQEERLVKISEEEEERYSQGVKNMEFDKYLGPYTLNQFGEWKMLSNYITKTTIQRIEPIGAEITIIHEPDIFTSLLESILIKEYGGMEDFLLGELQFAFVAFLMGQSLEAFLQWKNFVNLLFDCTEAPLHTRSNLFTKFIMVVYYQLKYAFQKENNVATKGSITLLDDSFLSSDSFLQHLCKEFFLLVLQAPFVDGDLLSWTRKLKELLESSLGWVFEHDMRDGIFYEDDDEFAPVVVMLEE